jgi:hypothetical protein
MFRSMPAVIPVALLLVGCGPDTSDNDGDGLEAWYEEEIGTDPDLVDSDADGHDDGGELSGNTDPLDAADHPYAGGWPIGACRDDIEASGDEVGDIANDWSLPDQFGEQVSLHSFCDRAVLLVAAAFW